MPTPNRRLFLPLALLPLLPGLVGCAAMGLEDAPKVQLAGLDSLPGQGMELRFMARLRVQNPRDQPLVYDGVSLDVDLRGQAFASGVAPVSGSVPRFGEALVNVPVTVSGFAIARQLLGLAQGNERPGGMPKVSYSIRGRLGGALGGTRFSSRGEIDFGVGGSATPSPASPLAPPR